MNIECDLCGKTMDIEKVDELGTKYLRFKLQCETEDCLVISRTQVVERRDLVEVAQ